LIVTFLRVLCFIYIQKHHRKNFSHKNHALKVVWTLPFLVKMAKYEIKAFLDLLMLECPFYCLKAYNIARVWSNIHNPKKWLKVTVILMNFKKM